MERKNPKNMAEAINISSDKYTQSVLEELSRTIADTIEQTTGNLPGKAEFNGLTEGMGSITAAAKKILGDINEAGEEMRMLRKSLAQSLENVEKKLEHQATQVNENISTSWEKTADSLNDRLQPQLERMAAMEIGINALEAGITNCNRAFEAHADKMSGEFNREAAILERLLSLQHETKQAGSQFQQTAEARLQQLETAQNELMQLCTGIQEALTSKKRPWYKRLFS